MHNFFTHKRVRVFIEQQDEETFLFGFTLRGQEVQSTTRTRLPGLAKRRAKMMLDRKLRDLHVAKKD
jgi:hypothetical protein